MIVLRLIPLYMLGLLGNVVVAGLIILCSHVSQAVRGFVRDLACVIRNWNEIVYALHHMDDPEEGA